MKAEKCQLVQGTKSANGRMKTADVLIIFPNSLLPEMARSIQAREVVESGMTFKVLRLTTAGKSDDSLKTGYAYKCILQRQPSFGLSALHPEPETLSYKGIY